MEHRRPCIGGCGLAITPAYVAPRGGAIPQTRALREKSLNGSVNRLRINFAVWGEKISDRNPAYVEKVRTNG
ncbi:hypothetical protein ACTMTU_09065 [Streptomyces sp. OZ13]|uniref:hypothetical protein n=1 Tax=Streptomyces sp. OZ13 TaxID=3452210 RepID=UPI003F8C2AD6